MSRPPEELVYQEAAEMLANDPDCDEAIRLYAQDKMSTHAFADRMAFLKECAQGKAYDRIQNEYDQKNDEGDMVRSMEQEECWEHG